MRRGPRNRRTPNERATTLAGSYQAPDDDIVQRSSERQASGESKGSVQRSVAERWRMLQVLCSPNPPSPLPGWALLPSPSRGECRAEPRSDAEARRAETSVPEFADAKSRCIRYTVDCSHGSGLETGSPMPYVQADSACDVRTSAPSSYGHVQGRSEVALLRHEELEYS
jgi:hypothetical protein